MAIARVILDWVREYGIKSLVNAPCAGSDCDVFKDNGVVETLGVNIIDMAPNVCSAFIKADLCVWRPEKEYDAVYINCIFCTSNDSPSGNHRTLAENYASWPMRYIVVYDTAVNPFDWAVIFREHGWECIKISKESGVPYRPEDTTWETRCEVWERAA